MCQVQAGAYVSLLTPGGTKYSDCHPSKTTTYVYTCTQRCVFIVWISFGLNESTLTYIQYIYKVHDVAGECFSRSMTIRCV